MNYDKQYFLRKFEAIPEDRWITQSYSCQSNHCALGHCGATNYRPTNESSALLLLIPHTDSINDGKHRRYQQPTPKQRILAALHDLP